MSILRAFGDGVRTGMGEELPVAPHAPFEVELRVERGAGWTLRLIADRTNRVFHRALREITRPAHGRFRRAGG